jgi:hypothetical protein
MATERQRILGSFLTGPGVQFSDAGNIYAFFGQAGTRSTTASPTLGYAFFFDAEGICEIWSKVSRIDVAFAMDVFGTDPIGGDSFTQSVTFGASSVNNIATTTEESRIQNLLGVGPVFNPAAPIVGSFTYQKNSDPPVSGTTDYSPALSISNASPNPYFFRTDTEMWLPSFRFSADIDFVPAFVPHIVFFVKSETQTAGTGETIRAATGAFNGDAFDLTVKMPTWLDISSLTLDIVYSQFYEYRDVNGQTPIWDQTTGAELFTHSTTLD